MTSLKSPPVHCLNHPDCLWIPVVNSSLYLSACYNEARAWPGSGGGKFLHGYKRVLFIGVSYDLNLSPLRVASSARGGIEISLLVRGVFEKQQIKL